jgi:hypothetical protein
MQCSLLSHPFLTLETNMKMRTAVLTVLSLFVGLAICFAANANSSMGTWKLNEAKSKIPAGFPKNLTVKYEAVGDNIKATVDGVDPKGNPTHNEWTGKFDGKDYPVTGDPSSDMRSYKMVDDNNVDLTVKKGGKVTMTAKIVTSADGKTRTLTASGMDPMGKKIEGTSVYDKQ